MKKSILAGTIFTIMFALQSCSHDNNAVVNNPTQTINQSLISGWWYRGLNAPVYKAYYFGTDSTYKQDQTNFSAGIGLGTWSWDTATIIKMTPTSGIQGTTVYLEITKLTQDSLVGRTPGTTQYLRVSRTNHN